jgi:hypothetical protein
MASTEGVSQLVDTSFPGLAPGALTLGLGLVAPVLRDRRAVASWTMDAVRPAEVPDRFNTFRVVNA